MTKQPTETLERRMNVADIDERSAAIVKTAQSALEILLNADDHIGPAERRQIVAKLECIATYAAHVREDAAHITEE